MTASAQSARFAQIVLPQLGDALGLARWLTGSPHDAEDVVQEACIRALAGIGGYAGGNPRAWVLAIVRNTAMDWLARNRPKSLTLTDDPAGLEARLSALPGFSTVEPGPEAALIARADAAAVEAAIASLPLSLRGTLILRDVNGLSYREIAAIEDIPLGTVMSRLARARGLLATQLGQKR
jgi:RNA polymerase sigma factor (sigma-70 family)